MRMVRTSSARMTTRWNTAATRTSARRRLPSSLTRRTTRTSRMSTSISCRRISRRRLSSSLSVTSLIQAVPSHLPSSSRTASLQLWLKTTMSSTKTTLRQEQLRSMSPSRTTTRVLPRQRLRSRIRLSNVH